VEGSRLSRRIRLRWRLKPAVVVIQAGTNDLVRVIRLSSEGTISDHSMSMVEL